MLYHPNSPKPVSQLSPNFGANMASHYSPLITISCSLAGIQLWPWCAANHVKTGGVFLGGRSNNFKALREKKVGCVQGRQNSPVYLGQESEGGSEGTWGRGQQAAVRFSRKQGFLQRATQSHGRFRQWGDFYYFHDSLVLLGLSEGARGKSWNGLENYFHALSWGWWCLAWGYGNGLWTKGRTRYILNRDTKNMFPTSVMHWSNGNASVLGNCARRGMEVWGVSRDPITDIKLGNLPSCLAESFVKLDMGGKGKEMKQREPTSRPVARAAQDLVVPFIEKRSPGKECIWGGGIQSSVLDVIRQGYVTIVWLLDQPNGWRRIKHFINETCTW